MKDKRNIMLVTCDKAINGSITDEGNRLTVILNGIDDGIYDIYSAGEYIDEADTNGRGRFLKKIDGEFSGDIVIKKDGEDVAWIKDSKENEAEVYEKTEAADTKEECAEEMVEEEKPDEYYREEYSSSSDISAIIARFREQMERLEKESVFDKREIEYVKEGKKEDEWVTICPDDIWALPVKNIKFPSSLFCIYGYIKFGNIYMKDMKDRYRIAVPDIFKNENTPAASRCGFYSISTLDGKEVKEGEMGYWMADILKTD